MGRKPNESETNSLGSKILLFLGIVSCTMVYLFMSAVLRPSETAITEPLTKLDEESGSHDGDGSDGCCRGIPQLELWGNAVKWGTDFKFNSSEECCKACKAMCTGKDGPCLCDSWVFCENKEACGSHFGECWLKKQKDTLNPDRHEAGKNVMWTSGLVFGKGEGIIGMETEYGTLHIKLLPECSPHSVEYILELLQLRHCAGCHFYRAEGRGKIWDSKGNHIKDIKYPSRINRRLTGPLYGRKLENYKRTFKLPFSKRYKEIRWKRKLEWCNYSIEFPRHHLNPAHPRLGKLSRNIPWKLPTTLL